MLDDITRLLRNELSAISSRLNILTDRVAVVPEYKQATVTAVAADQKTVTLSVPTLDAGGALTSVLVSGIFYVNSRPSVGDLVWYVDLGRGRYLVMGTVFLHRELLYGCNIDDQTSTTLVNIITQNSIFIAPCPLFMSVHATGRTGFSVNDNLQVLNLTDEAGVSITGLPDGYFGVDPGAGRWGAFSFYGTKTYAAGQVCGFRLQHRVAARPPLAAAGNGYVDGQCLVRFTKP